MNVLVTGGLGVNGIWIVRQLLAEGHRPIIFENRLDKFLCPDIADKLEIVLGDMSDLASVIRAVKEYKIKRIIHMAWVLFGFLPGNPSVPFKVNTTGTVNILEAARIMEVERVVFASSKSIYAPFTGEYGYPIYKPVNEDYPVFPGSPYMLQYGAAKIACELMGISYSEDYGFEFVALRAGAICGVGKTRHGPMAIHANMIENAMLDRPSKIACGGDERDDVVYVKDYAHAVVLACFAKNLKHRIFNIGTGRTYSLHDFARSIRKVYPEAIIEVGPGLDYMNVGQVYCCIDFSRARDELGYNPRFSLEEGVTDYIETMKKLDIQPFYRAFST